MDKVTPFSIMKAGFADLVKEFEQNRIARKAAGTKAKEEDGKIVLHASDLGKCPVSLYYTLMQAKDDTSTFQPWRVPSLNDGFVHEDATMSIIRRGLPNPDDWMLEENVQVPVLEVPDTNVVIWGECDAKVSRLQEEDEPGQHWVPWIIYEHKAVYNDTFIRYNMAPETIPQTYITQLAVYMVAEGAGVGMLIIKDRERSDFMPNPFEEDDWVQYSLSWEVAKEIVEQRVSMIAAIVNDGAVPEIPPILMQECVYCRHRSTCYREAMDSEVIAPDKKGVQELRLDDKQSKYATQITEELREYGRIKHELDTLSLRKIKIQTDLRDLLDFNGAKRMRTEVGNVTLITPKGRTYPDEKGKATIQRLIEDGTISTKVSEPDAFVRVGKLKV